jgi:hypothetical protein
VEVIGTKPMTVTVRGPGYNGWRPPEGQVDRANPDALHPNSNHEGAQTTSTMVVEIQEQNNANGFTGDLGWATIQGPIALTADFAGPKPSESPNEVEWTTYEPITLPSSRNPLRLRISELDYHGHQPPPVTIDSSIRRPFVCLIPIP